MRVVAELLSRNLARLYKLQFGIGTRPAIAIHIWSVRHDALLVLRIDASTGQNTSWALVTMSDQRGLEAALNGNAPVNPTTKKAVIVNR